MVTFRPVGVIFPFLMGFVLSKKRESKARKSKQFLTLRNLATSFHLGSSKPIGYLYQCGRKPIHLDYSGTNTSICGLPVLIFMISIPSPQGNTTITGPSHWNYRLEMIYFIAVLYFMVFRKLRKGVSVELSIKVFLQSILPLFYLYTCPVLSFILLYPA